MVSSLPANSTDQKADKTSFYNFSKLKKNRKWLKVFNILHLTTDICILLIYTLHDSSFLHGFFFIPSLLVPSLSPAEYPVE